jgi:ligand-binding sensor domain-containing protein
MKKITTYALTVCLTIMALNISAQTFTNYTTVEGLPHNNVLCLTQDTAGNMWFGTQEGIARFDGVSTWTIYDTASHPTLVHNTITAIAADSDNNIWVGTDYGVSVFDGATFTTYTTNDGLGDNRINYITQAPNGDIWFGDFDGATVYDGANFTAYNTSHGLPFGGINMVDFDSGGDVYMASGLGGVVQFDGANFTVYNTGLESNTVRAIAVDAADNKWVGTARGISVMNSSNVVVDAHTIMLILPAPDTLNPVEDVKINSVGDIWTGIYVDYLVTEGGVAVNKGGPSWTDYDVNDGLVGPVVRKITIDDQDNIWVGTSTGVSKLSVPVGINEPSYTSNVLDLYPNPTSDVLNIELKDDVDYSANIELYNTSLQLAKSLPTNVQESFYTVSVSDLDRGLYFVKVGNKMSKVIVD